MMTESEGKKTGFKRSPMKRLFVEDILAGEWQETEKAALTRYGSIKRCRIVGTVVNQRDVIKEDTEGSFITERPGSNRRLVYQIDDGTGNIWATQWGVAIEDPHDIKTGMMVDCVGTIRFYRKYPGITVEYIRKINDPNIELYHMAEVIKKRLFEPTFQVIKQAPTDLDYGSSFPSEVSQEMESIVGKSSQKKKKSSQKSKTKAREKEGDLLQPLEKVKVSKAMKKIDNEEIQSNEKEDSFSSDDSELDFQEMLKELEKDSNSISESNENIESSSRVPIIESSPDVLERIIQIIAQNDTGDGVSIQKIAQELQLSLDQLKPLLEQLTQDIKIFKTQPGYYSVY
jgi:RPA family protein